MKPSKCFLRRKEVLYLGHKITREGIATDPAKIEAVNKWLTPTTVQELQKFLGLAGYYRRYVKDFASLAQPLFRLMERGREFKWTQECSEAYAILKLRLTSAPILAFFPDFKAVFVLDTDASESGIGAVLSQVDIDGEERVIAYASRVLNKAEPKYSVTRKELLAVVTFIKHFRSYLLGRHFILRTDHSSLQWLYTFKKPEGQIARWLEKLQEFDIEMVHRSGRNHGNADALSRSRLLPEQDVNVNTLLGLVVSEKSIQQLQLQDKSIGPVYQAMQDGSKPGPETTRARVALENFCS